MFLLSSFYSEYEWCVENFYYQVRFANESSIDESSIFYLNYEFDPPALYVKTDNNNDAGTYDFKLEYGYDDSNVFVRRNMFLSEFVVYNSSFFNITIEEYDECQYSTASFIRLETNSYIYNLNSP